MNLKIGFFLLVVGPFLFSGCAKLEHLDELLTLKSYSDEQEAITRTVKAQDAKFDQLLTAARGGTLKTCGWRTEVLKQFGPPIYEKETACARGPCHVWLYRYATEFSNTPKVYISFDKTGRLMDYQLVDTAPVTKLAKDHPTKAQP
jgi:hypothetical protein